MKIIKKHFLYFLLMIIFGILVYVPSFKAPFQLDDIAIIEKNTAIRSLNNIEKIWDFDPSRFIPHLSFACNYKVGQFNPETYHFVNFFIHLLTVIMVFLFLRELFSVCLRGEKKRFLTPEISAFFAAFIFLVHPIQTSAVTYIVQRSTLLASFFYILSLYLYVLFRRNKNVKFYVFSILAAGLGALCKPIIITLPFILIYLELFVFTKEEMSENRSVKKDSHKRLFGSIFVLLLPYLCLLFFIPFLMMLYIKNFNLLEITSQTDAISRKDYLLTQFNVLIKYISLLFFPNNQNLDYDYPISTTLFSFPTIFSFSILFSILILGLKYLYKNKLLSFAIFFFFISLSLESSIFPLSDVIFEHRLYLPMLGFVVLVPQLDYLIKNKKVIKFILIIIIILLSWMTFKRNELWSNKIKFLEDGAKKSYNKARPQVNLGIAYMQKELYELSMRSFNKALGIDPEYVKAYLGLGVLYNKLGKYDKALAYLIRAIALDPFNDQAFNNIGVLLVIKDRKEEALTYFNKAIFLNSDNYKAFNNRARLFEESGKYKLAIKDYTSAIEIDDASVLMYLNRARVYELNDQIKKALEDLYKVQSFGYPGRKEYINNMKRRMKN